MIFARRSCTMLIISSSSLYVTLPPAPSAVTPYAARVFGLVPPLSSRAEMKPGSFVILIRDTIRCEGFWAGATALIKGRDEAWIICHLLQLFLLEGIAGHLAGFAGNSTATWCEEL